MTSAKDGRLRSIREMIDILNDYHHETQEDEAAHHRDYFEQMMREQFMWDRRNGKGTK
jgi:hypothetical protein